MGFRGQYWSCSSFADVIWKLSGAAPKPTSATSADWKKWRIDRQTNHPIAYWIVEEGLGKAQDFVNWPMDKFNDVRCYIRNRWVYQNHMLPTYLPKGKWQEFDERLLHGMFGALVDFVETDMAYDQLSWGSLADESDITKRPWWMRFRLSHWGKFRSRELGMKRVEWHISLGDPREDEYGNDCSNVRQSNMGKEIKVLYQWWVFDRPARGDVWEDSGTNEFFNDDTDLDDILGDNTPPDKEALRRTAMDRMAAMEKHYKQEDEDMMIRLVKLREWLWT